MGSPGTEETLVIERKADLDKLEERADAMANGKETEEPKNRVLLESLKGIDLGKPLDRVSENLKTLFPTWITRNHNVYQLEISSQKTLSKARRKEVLEIRQNIQDSFGSGVSGAILDTDFQDDGAQLMVWSTGEKLREFVMELEWQRKITFFDVPPEFETFSQTLQDFNIADTTILPPPENAETICIIDSGVAAGNPFLAPVLKRKESRSWVYGASPLEDACGHGSGVASLAAYYTIDPRKGSVHQARAWITSARIMNDHGELDTPQTGDIDQDREHECKLLSTILREIVEHFTSFGVRIFVLSFEIRGQSWSLATRHDVSRSSWVARTIDQLSAEFDVVFCCITGNISRNDVQDLIQHHGYPNYLTNPLAKLLDPGQAALAITAGSIAHSERVTGGRHTPIARIAQPSPFSRTGPGFGDSIKPDVVEYGGNLVQDFETKLVWENQQTNVLMASGQLPKPLCHCSGTSYAAPRVAHHAAIVLSELRGELKLDNPSGALIRALLANSATKVEVDTAISSEDALEMAGHGLPHYENALNCQNHSVLLYWDGKLKPNHAALFRLHVPTDLTNYAGSRKLISVSLAITPPVQKWGVSDYLGTRPKFWLFRGDQDWDAIEKMMQRDDDEKNVAGDSVEHIAKSELGITRRTAGTLQADRFEWTNHKEEYSKSDYCLAVSLSKPAGWLRQELELPVAIVARIEERSGRFKQLYARVKTRTEVRVKS